MGSINAVGGAANAAALAQEAAEAAGKERKAPEPTAEDVVVKTAELFGWVQADIAKRFVVQDVVGRRGEVEKAFEDQAKKAMEGK